ncbi:MAG: FHA domain-containing protein [Bacteriovoracaceae bacterium]
MIEITILKTPDTFMLGTYLYHKNSIIIGREKGDLLIDDDKIINNHLKIEFRENTLFSFKNSKVSSYHLNNKYTDSAYPLNKGDQIQIGDTTILIKSFNFILPFDKTTLIAKNLNEIIANNKEILKTIEVLEKKIKDYDVSKIS